MTSTMCGKGICGNIVNITSSQKNEFGNPTIAYPLKKEERKSKK